MIDLRNLTDYQRALQFPSKIPRWAYFVAFYGVAAVGYFILFRLAVIFALALKWS